MTTDVSKIILTAFSDFSHIVYKYLNLEGSKAMLSDSRLKFTNPSMFNDPYDCYKGLINFEVIPESDRERYVKTISPSINRKEKRYLLKNSKSKLDTDIKKAYLEKGMSAIFSIQRICCFSKEVNNLLMWSHYADSHKGICIGFDIYKLSRSLENSLNENISFFEVDYKDEFESVNFFTDREKAIYNWMRTKSKSWIYEKEIRASFDIKDMGKVKLVPFDKEAINGIFLGSNMEEKDETTIKEICRENYPNAKIFKMNLDKNSFNLLAKPIK